jgi:hypothetical protein
MPGPVMDVLYAGIPITEHAMRGIRGRNPSLKPAGPGGVRNSLLPQFQASPGRAGQCRVSRIQWNLAHPVQEDCHSPKEWLVTAR